MPDDEMTTPEQDGTADGEAADEQPAEVPAEGEAALPDADADADSGDGGGQTTDGESTSEGSASVEDAAPDGADAAAPDGDPPASDAGAAEPGAADAEAPFNANVMSEALGIDPEVDAAVVAAVGDGAAQLDELGSRVAEAFLVGLETVTSHAAKIESVTVTATDYAAVESEFASVDHVGLELRVSLSETEAHLAGVLIPLDGLSALLKVDASAEQMADADFASAQIETISASARELLDHLSVTVVPGELTGAEVTLSEARLGQVDFTMGMIADVAQNATPVRIDLTLSLPDGGTASLSLIVPGELLGRIAGSVVGAAAGGEATDDAAAEPQAPGTLGTDPTNVTPFPAPPGAPAADAMPSFPPLDAGGEPAFPPLGAAAEGGAAPDGDAPVHPVRFPELTESEALGAFQQRSIDMLMDVSMKVTVELGRSSMTIESVLGLGPGSVVELNKLAGEPVDVLINERLIARGEVVVVDENFGVRVTEIVSPRTRANVIGR
ncbi:MAG: flagellar motor switch protein FliN [Dehalococcoidia bacterium]